MPIQSLDLVVQIYRAYTGLLLQIILLCELLVSFGVEGIEVLHKPYDHITFCYTKIQFMKNLYIIIIISNILCFLIYNDFYFWPMSLLFLMDIIFILSITTPTYNSCSGIQSFHPAACFKLLADMTILLSLKQKFISGSKSRVVHLFFKHNKGFGYFTRFMSAMTMTFVRNKNKFALF